MLLEQVCPNLRFPLPPHLPLSNPPPRRLFSSFFNHGQVLPCHRLKHSPFGGPFQPCVAQAIRLLSTPPSPSAAPTPQSPAWYTTTGADVIPSPLTHAQHRRYSWVHVFPEGMVHQHASTDLRYFKWGVARLILESDPAPDVLPMFIDGTQRVMPEDRAFPRFLPRVGKKVRVGFGEVLDYEATFGDLRRRWEGLVRREQERISSNRSGRSSSRRGSGGGDGEQQRQEKGGWGLGSLMPTSPWTARKTEEKGPSLALSQLRPSQPPLPGELVTDELKYGREAQEIRIEVAQRLRDEILKVRKSLGGFPEPDPSFALAETWRLDGSIEAKKYTSRVDGSNINQD